MQPLAHTETSSLASLAWLSELPSWIGKVTNLREDIQRKRESTNLITYDGNIQDRFTKLHEFIDDCGRSASTLARRLRTMRIRFALESGRSPDTKLDNICDKLIKLGNICDTLILMRETCDKAAHQFLRKSWEYDCKELNKIVQLMETLHYGARSGDVGLNSLGAHNEKAPASADGERAKKPLCEDDAGLELRSLEQRV
jgi:hypothetical protein